MLYSVLTVASGALGVIGLAYVTVKTLWPWILVDLKYLGSLVPVTMRFIRTMARNEFIVEAFEKCVQETPDKIFTRFGDIAISYKEANERATMIARVARQQLGLKRGSVVALMMINTPEFVCTYLGLQKIGVVISFINYNLRQKSLLHCLTASETNLLIVGDESSLLEAVNEIKSQMQDTEVYVHGGSHQSTPLPVGFKRLDDLFKLVDETDVIDSSLRAGQHRQDPACYIFTSGTTGLPKPAIVTLQKLSAGVVLTNAAQVTADDVMYVTFPMYHSLGLIVGINGAIINGCTCVLAKSFSKTGFLPDCKRHGVTVILYIGESCRYLLSNPPEPHDKDHCIRVAIGSGLRGDIFEQFRKRFAISKIVEFYGLTEGTMGFLNVFNIDRSCGRLSPLLARSMKSGLFKWDIEQECLVRDKNGLCIPVKQGEPGLLLMGISPAQPYSGYKGNPEMSERKVIRDVKVKGDKYLNTGDLMKQDAVYNLYFSDRLGDTFRWKGENVSTTEVSNSLTEMDFILDACVYGVKVPGCDGKAGMATLLVTPTSPGDGDISVDLSSLADHCTRALPAYSIPMFVRLKHDALDMTSTIKQTKMKLKTEGFDRTIVQDQMFYYERSQRQYKELSEQAYRDICNHKISF